MKSDDQLEEILKEIGREYRSIGAPDWLEPKLLAAAAKGNSGGKRKMQLVWALTAAAIVLATVLSAGIVWQKRESDRLQTKQTLSAPVTEARPEPVPSSAHEDGREKVAVKPASERRAGGHRAPGSKSKQPTLNSLDEFVSLPASEGLPPAAELSIVRMQLRASDLQQYGLQAPADGVAQTMLAEFAVGEDGLPRAIRIVR